MTTSQGADWKKRFDAEFHERIWDIVKMVSPVSYSMKDHDPDGPQIYGEMKDWIDKELSLQRTALIQQVREKMDEIEIKGSDKKGNGLIWRWQVEDVLSQLSTLEEGER